MCCALVLVWWLKACYVLCAVKVPCVLAPSGHSLATQGSFKLSRAHACTSPQKNENHGDSAWAREWLCFHDVRCSSVERTISGVWVQCTMDACMYVIVKVRVTGCTL